MVDEVFKTPIEGLKIKINKVISDSRGVLCEILPDGIDNKFIGHKIGNIYTSTSTGKEPRAGHYHFKNKETFYVISGTALWMFKDYRKDSPTFGKVYGIVVGFEDKKINGIESYTIDKNQMAQVFVPIGVYHVYYPIRGKPVTVLAISSEPHDNKDYVRIDPEEIEELKNMIKMIS